MDEGTDIEIHRVVARGGYDSTFDVTFANQWDGTQSTMVVEAGDELTASIVATKILTRHRMMVRTVIICSTLIILTLFGVLGYGCQQPSDMQACIAAGKTFVSVDSNTSEKSDLYMCK